MPFLVIAVEGLARCDALREAAATLCRRWTTFRRHAALVAPGGASAVLWPGRWASSARRSRSGSFPGVTETMPIAVYLTLETDLDGAIVLSLLLLVVSVGILASLRDRWVNASS
jgi:molybdate transport system permease protein